MLINLGTLKDNWLQKDSHAELSWEQRDEYKKWLTECYSKLLRKNE